jgi:glycosyltransferase involved in cell wall biosynthesis
MALVINGRFLQRPITGVERYSHMLLRVIAKEWPDSRVVIPDPTPKDPETYGLEVVRVRGKGGHSWEQLLLPRSVAKGDLLLSPANTGPLRVRHQVVVLHDLAVIHHPEWFDRRFAAWYRFLMPKLAKHVEHVITVSEESATDIMDTFGPPRAKVTVVPPFATEVSSFPDTPVHGPYILAVASRDPRKGLGRLVAWYSAMKDPAYDLVIVGRTKGPFRSVPLKTHPGIIFREDVNDAELHGLYRNAIALVHLSKAEGFGLPILEALQHGCPVIASDLPVFKRNFGGSLFYVSENHDEVLHHLILGLQTPNRRAHFAMRGKLRAGQFTEQRMTNALHHVLDPLLKS